jgi:hypothetical protein
LDQSDPVSYPAKKRKGLGCSPRPFRWRGGEREFGRERGERRRKVALFILYYAGGSEMCAAISIYRQIVLRTGSLLPEAIFESLEADNPLGR